MQTALTFFYNLTASLGFASYGIAIILLTIAIKMALYPLTVKQIKSMKAMQDIQPKMKAIQEKYKGNPEKQQKELAALYKEAGINPLAGCLPLLVQMPFLMSIFFAIRDYQYAQQPPSFLWLTDLSHADPYYILPVLSALTTFLMQKQTVTDATQQNKMMLVFMPLFIGYISMTFPAGLVVYWVVGNIIQILQQWFMYRNPVEVREGAR
ncbi:MAG TPA: YidC/Oxa1 family membrane protein insertase [Methylomusa anaerophila]|nr:YidC/Oxa1 family membrane protein insertase [Methylomusa anaerophila]HML88821.1 YidC/Oxa1 family membrane protein insertase [Methylomusa anaerophila]